MTDYFTRLELEKVDSVFEGRAKWVAANFLIEGYEEAKRIRELKKKVLRILKNNPEQK